MEKNYSDKLELLNKKNFWDEMESDRLFNCIVMYVDDDDMRTILRYNAVKIIRKCMINFDMFNLLTILWLRNKGIEKEICNDIIDGTVKNIFSNDTILFIAKRIREINENNLFFREDLFDDILSKLREMPTDKSSRILFDLYIFIDFKEYLDRTHRVIATLINAYQLYDVNVVSSSIFNGSTIIGRLLMGNNEMIAGVYLCQLLGDEKLTTQNIKMIGGGGSSLVYQINDFVIKLGEKRNCRKIFINHRILASLIRKLVISEDNEELFYVEVMKYARVGDVSIDERDELKQDLYEQGLIWDDDKLENCGVLVEDDENICTLPVDYIEVAGKIDNPYRREQFMKRKRKVVVIDNDNITYNSLKSSG